MGPRAAYRFLKRGRANAFLLLAFHRVVHEDTPLEDVQLPWGEPGYIRQEGAARVFERVR